MASTHPAQSATTTFHNPAQKSSSQELSNPVMECLLTHSSDRSYKSDPIDDTVLMQVLKAGHRAPTSCNSQQISVIVVKNPETKKQIAELAYHQPYIIQCPVFLVICGDLRKANMAIQKQASKSEAMTETLEGFAQICVDSGIALQAMMLAARSFDLGVVPIGAIRADLSTLSKLLNLPPRVVPVLGMCLGHVEKHAPLKPRMDFSTFAHMEKYTLEDEVLSKTVEDYDQVLMDHWNKVARQNGGTYSQSMTELFANPWYPNLRSELKEQHYIV